ncbi:MAG: hypothetical protein ACD_7C00264G0003, partial [uncultured bacterium]
ILAREVNGVKRNELSEWILCNSFIYEVFSYRIHNIVIFVNIM